MDFVRTKDGVQLDQLHPPLATALQYLGQLHHLLFGRELLVTSANDGQHATGSKHYRNLAFDMRSWDKTAVEQLLWAMVLEHASRRYNLAVFDERQRDVSPHWHIELAD